MSMESDRQIEANRLTGELEGHLNHRLMCHALTGCALRSLRALNHNANGVQAVGGNELKARTLVLLAEHLERLIRDGAHLDAALDAMRHEDWLIRIDNFEMME